MTGQRIGLLVGSALIATACNSPTKSTTSGTTGLAGLTLNAASVVAGTSTQAVVTLASAAAAPGASVALSSNAAWVTTPASVMVPTGATTATFTIATTAVDTTSVATITAAYANTKVTTTLTVTAEQKSIVNLSITPNSLTGGNASQGTITLSSPAPASGASVALSSSNTTAVSIPSTVSISSGASTATFAINTFAVTAAADVTIVAAYGGGSKTATMTVMPPATLLISLTVTPASVTGGQAAQGSVTLSTPAGPGGAFVSLTSSRTSVNVPSVVIVTAGATSATFTITTSPVSIATDALIASSYNGATRTAPLLLTP